jgi:hypothetical protein
MNHAISNAMVSVIDRLLGLAETDPALKLGLRSVARQYLDTTKDDPVNEVVSLRPVTEPVGTMAAPASDPTAKSELPIIPYKPSLRAVNPPKVQSAMDNGFEEEPQQRAAEWTDRYLEVGDDELPMIEARCRLKAEAAEWAGSRQERLRDPSTAFQDDIAPLDHKMFDRANQLTDCFLWMCHPRAPRPIDRAGWVDVVGCFNAVAAGIGFIRALLETPVDGTMLNDAILMLAQAQSALRIAIECIDGPVDRDQKKVYRWLRTTASARTVYIPRYMRLDDPADPTTWRKLVEHIDMSHSSFKQIQQTEQLRQSLFNRVRFHIRAITSKTEYQSIQDWNTVVNCVGDLIEAGLPPSNRELRDLLLPVIEKMPDIGEIPVAFRLVLRHIDLFLATRPPVVVAADEPFNAEVEELAKLISGKTIVLIGADCRTHAKTALVVAFGLKAVDWVNTTEHQSFTSFESHVYQPDVAVVLLAIRWSSHGHGEVSGYCTKHGTPLVRLPTGYNPNMVAMQILSQCGDYLRKKYGR